MGKINTDNYPNRPVTDYQDDDMFILQDNGGETYTTNVGDIKNLADSRIKLEGVQVNGSDLPISGKKVNVDISGKTDLSVIAYTFNPEMGYFKGAYVTYNGKLYEFIQEHTGAWNPSHVREIRASGQYVRTGNGGYNNGDRATCEGYMTKASGNYSHAEGRETQAVGDCTHAEGRETIANGIYQHVEGKYNIADNESKYIHIIGNGIDDNNRSNAMTVDWDGNLEVSGDVEDGNGEKISDKADKVTNATSGHLAGLDANGNLTDSGVSPTEDVTVEGNPVTFDSPFEQDAKSVVVTVKPIQAGSGTPSPDNIRPISGIGEVEIGVVGKNKWDDPTYTKTKTGEGFYIGTTNTPVSLNRTLSAGNYVMSFDWQGGTYPSDAFALKYYMDSVGSIDFIVGANSRTVIPFTATSPFNGVTLYGVHAGTVSNIQIEEGTEATPYEPYKGSTTTIPLPSTLYDADVDVTEGDADSRFGIVDLGTLDWTYAPMSGGRQRFQTTITGLRPSRNGTDVLPAICSQYTAVSYNSSWINGNMSYSDQINSNNISIIDNSYDNESDFKTAMNGVQFCYELATPTTISFDPTNVELLEGTNVVSTNAEKVAVTYGRSLWQDIDKLKTDTEGKLDKSDVATIEGDTASKAYSVNDFMLRSDGFYRVTAPIASGASITSSNTTKTTIGAVLTALLNA